MNGYEPLLTDECVCRDCDLFCYGGTHTPAPCEVDGCQCETCGNQIRRARELDDRPDNKLHVIAAELERERLPTLDELRAERYGYGRGRAA